MNSLARDSIDLFSPDVSGEMGEYGRDFRISNGIGRIEVLPYIIGPEVEVFLQNNAIEPRRYRGLRDQDMRVLVDDDEFALTAIAFALEESKEIV